MCSNRSRLLWLTQRDRTHNCACQQKAIRNFSFCSGKKKKLFKFLFINLHKSILYIFVLMIYGEASVPVSLPFIYSSKFFMSLFSLPRSIQRSIDRLPHIIVNFMLKRKTICFLFSLALSLSFARRRNGEFVGLKIEWKEKKRVFNHKYQKYCVSIYPFFQIAFHFFFACACVWCELWCLCSLTERRRKRPD